MLHKTTDGLNLYYEVQGNIQSDKTLVFLNGLSQTTIAWGLVTIHFQNYKLVLCDFIFQGQSDKIGESRDFDEHAADVKGLLDQLGIFNPILIGISYGSLVAQNFAVNYPNQINTLILLSTFAHKTPYFNAIELSWQNALDSGGYDLMLDVMLPFVLSENYFAKPLSTLSFLLS